MRLPRMTFLSFFYVLSLTQLRPVVWDTRKRGLHGCVTATCMCADIWLHNTLPPKTCNLSHTVKSQRWNWSLMDRMRDPLHVTWTHLHSHGDVLLSYIMVVLVGVQHDDGVRQSEAGVVDLEGITVHFLHTREREHVQLRRQEYHHHVT